MKRYVVVTHACDRSTESYAIAFPFTEETREALYSICAGCSFSYTVTVNSLRVLKYLESIGVHVSIFRGPEWDKINGLFGLYPSKVSRDELLYAGGMFGVFQKPRKPSQIK